MNEAHSGKYNIDRCTTVTNCETKTEK